MSDSYNSFYGGVLYPDNWLLTPEFVGGGTISFWMNPLSKSYGEDIVGVYVTTDNGQTWSEELLHIVPEEGTVDSVEYRVNLSEYKDQNIKVAFRHYDSVDQYAAVIDYITILPPTGTVTFLVQGKVLEKYEDIAHLDALPNGVEWYGFEFVGWDKTLDEINEALANGEDVTVNAKFIPLATQIIVTTIIDDEAIEKIYTESTWVTVRAKTMLGGRYFTYWSLNGVAVSYSPKATIRIVTSCTLEAHYADEPIETQAVADLIKATFDGVSNRETFVMYIGAPEGATIVDAGLFAASGANYNPDDGELTDSNADYVKHAEITNPNQPVSYTWIKTKVNEGDVWYIRGFITYELNGETLTYYGTLAVITAGEDFAA